ncbi:NHERF family PDZ scaffold protein 4b isoform X2 [Dunckerocampus dactyliophorus]|uniref:NHERF family PDZ scaffold protein 4b isoform X2 n=1 Tax=Dunckerocampus dactyliophorus TaxID=161453 RepID=UPI002404BB1C|nr:NHERF family PDZ scaffold protein 4b isoform X2 [Dunckerocampus dactyliophorus]
MMVLQLKCARAALPGRLTNGFSGTPMPQLSGPGETSTELKFTFNPKEGIDNPLMVITEESTPRPRLCVLRKEEGQSYGFHLRLEWTQQGHIIRKVVSGGVAERCGLEDGDRLLEVNNVYVEDAPHQEVAKRIRLSGHHLCLLVLDGDEYEKAVAWGHDLRDVARTHKGDNSEPPRLCHIIRDPVSGLGVSFTPVGAEKGCFSVNLVAGGAAEKAGVRKGDRLVWMNGAAVSDLTHSALRRMMKKCGTHITILVIDSESEKKYAKLNMPVLPCMAVAHNLPYSSRKLHLDSAPEGYGFLLRFERAPSGRTAHVVRKVDAGSPAHKAGMRDGEVLLEVNGVSVESLQHDEIVKTVRASGRHISFTTITPQGQEFYTQLGLPPLLFCEDDVIETGSSEAVQAAEHYPQKDTSCDPSKHSRVCSLQKGPLGFGFNLGCVPQRPGTFVSQVAAGSPGEKAGLNVGDVVVEVNWQNVEDQCLEDVVKLVTEGGQELCLRVTDNVSCERTKQADTHAVTNSREEDTEDSRL